MKHPINWVPTDCGGVWPNGERWELQWLNPRAGYYQTVGRVIKMCPGPGFIWALYNQTRVEPDNTLKDYSGGSGIVSTMIEGAKALEESFNAVYV